MINQTYIIFQGTEVSIASLQTESHSRHTSCRDHLWQSCAGLCGMAPWIIKADVQGGCICLSSDLQFFPFPCCLSHSVFSLYCLSPILPSSFPLSCPLAGPPFRHRAVCLPPRSRASLMTVSLSF